MRRREFLESAAAAGAMLGLPLSSAPTEGATDVEIRLSAGADSVSIRKDSPTRILRFSGEVLKGRRDAVRPMGSYLGPTFDLRRGERVRVRFENHAGEPSIVHWHGLIVPDEADGHPRFAVPSGKSYTYEFTVKNPAGTYLYHPHPHGRTGYQVYNGLVGLLLIRDQAESTAGLPGGPYELPLVIQDRRFDADNQLVFSDGMMDEMNGVLGDTILVNGKADAAFNVSPRAYRLRVLNASNARIYKLAWSDGRPLTVVGTDNGLLSSATGPQTRPYLMLGPTERVEVLEDFGTRPAGTELALVSHAFDSGTHMRMMGGGMMGGRMMGEGMMGEGMMSRGMMPDGTRGATQGEELLVARFTISGERRQPAPAVSLPPQEAALKDPAVEIRTRLAFRHMRGLLNDREFEMDAVARDERVPRNEPIVWTFEHEESGMGMHMPHPMHVHGVRFRVVERERGREAPSDVADGFVDEGYKDTALVFPGERVKLHLEATEPGLFMYHCHNLEHEDGGMMRNYLVES